MAVRHVRGWVVVALAAPALSCSTVSSTVGLVTGSTQRKEAQAQVAEIQAAVMRLSDSYTAAVVESVSAIPSNTAEAQRRVLEYQIDQITAVYQIAAAPNPLANAVDLAVLTSMSARVTEDYWIPQVWGEAGRPLLRSYRALERQAWEIVSRFLDADQQKGLRELIASYHESYPNLRQAAFIRVADLAQARAKQTGGLGSPTDILGSVGLDIFGGLDPAVQQMDQARVLAERALFYAQRSPRLLDMQAQLLTLQLSGQPASQQLLESTTRITSAAERVAVVAAELPATIDRQREATIRQFMTALEDQEVRSRALLVELRQTLQAGGGAADSVNEAIRSANVLLASVNRPPPPGAPPPPPAAPGKPFDVAEYTRALGELGKTARDLQGLVQSLDRSVPQVEALAREVTDHAFRRLATLIVVLVGAVLLAAVGYRWAAARIARPSP